MPEQRCPNCKSSFRMASYKDGHSYYYCVKCYKEYDHKFIGNPEDNTCGWPGCQEKGVWYLNAIEKWTCNPHGYLYP